METSIKQYEEAINLSLKQLRDLQLMEECHDFLDAHILLLEDEILKQEVIDTVAKHQISAFEAFAVVMDKYIDIMKGSSDEYLKDRYLDFLDIKTRVLQNFNKTRVSLANLDECIILIDELFL